MGALWALGELIGFDLETTGVDRFEDVPVSFALVTSVDGQVRARQSGLINPGRPIPNAASQIHGISTATAMAEGMPLDDAVDMLVTRLVDASWRGVPLVGMKLDYDLTILDVQCRRLDGRVSESGGGVDRSSTAWFSIDSSTGSDEGAGR